jgi:hypothetical protein
VNAVPWLQKLKSAVEGVRSLKTQVDKFVTAPASQSKRVPFFGAQHVPCPTGDFSLQERTYVNGGDDIYIDRINALVLSGAAGTTVAGQNAEAIFATEAGYSAGTFLTVANYPNYRVFDFLWNYKLASTGALYASSANSLALLSRKSLGNNERAMPLNFEDVPLVLRAGDAVTFMVKPIVFRTPSTASPSMFIVSFSLWGYRTGVMAL